MDLFGITWIPKILIYILIKDYKQLMQIKIEIYLY